MAVVVLLACNRDGALAQRHRPEVNMAVKKYGMRHLRAAIP